MKDSLFGRAIEGRFRILQEPDGWCVVGEGLVLPVDSYEEALQILKEIEEKTSASIRKDVLPKEQPS